MRRWFQPLLQPAYVGFLSREAAHKYGAVIYLNTNGEKVLVTAVHRLPMYLAMIWATMNYKWKDWTSVGILSGKSIGCVEGKTKTKHRKTKSGDIMSYHAPGRPGEIHWWNRYNRSNLRQFGSISKPVSWAW